MSLLGDILAFFRRPRPAPTPLPPPPAPLPPLPPDARQLGVEIMVARAAQGLNGFPQAGKLDVVAQAWAESMARTGILDHGDPARRIAGAFPGLPSGECIAEGQSSAAQVVADWMGHPPHRRILLGRYYLMGCGVARSRDGTTFWVADFVGDPS
jgi:uncharacterized protein YkwD